MFTRLYAPFIPLKYIHYAGILSTTLGEQQLD
jgi:hypothetical protein